MEGQPEHIRRAFTLDNASNKDVLKHRIQHAVKKFQKHALDYGSSGVQSSLS